MSAATEKERRSFCWEWFEIKSDSKAIKLQETGELAIGFEEVDSRWEIAYTYFHSDVSFRICPYTSEKPKETKPAWRLNIRQGSYLDWPSIFDGEVIFTPNHTADGRKDQAALPKLLPAPDKAIGFPNE